jgi:hypothetical protein
MIEKFRMLRGVIESRTGHCTIRSRGDRIGGAHVSFWTWVVFLAAVCLLIARARRRRGRIGPASAGAIDDLLHQDRKKAIEIIVEERAAARDPETVDGLISNPESQVPTPKTQS